MKLLNRAREASERLVDALDLRDRNGKRIRTYREVARKCFTGFSRNCKKNRPRDIRRQVGKQLGFLGRNINNIWTLASLDRILSLSKKDLHDLAVIGKVYEQQKEMHDNHKHQCRDRIVSITQDWVRPIKRGKAGADTEFGLKATFCKVDGLVYVAKMDFDSYNEGGTLKEIIEQYFKDFGVYPEEVLADRIYHNMENRRFCEEKCIKFIGKKLGREPRNGEKVREQERAEYKAMCDRIEIEGSFGRGKRRFGLNLIKMKLKETTKTQVCLIALMLNLCHSC